jgi:polyhydroxyalkanoate synthase
MHERYPLSLQARLIHVNGRFPGCFILFLLNSPEASVQVPSLVIQPENSVERNRSWPPAHLSAMTPNPLAIADAQWQEATLRILLGRLTGGISPASVIAAYTDWLTHLATAPGKQAELVQKAWRKASRLALYAAQSMVRECPPGIEPLPQDRRFAGPGWRQWPFNVWSQAFLLNQQWWWNATTGVRGVTRHHEDVVTFVNRQLLDMVAPSNFLPTNPEVLQEMLHAGGANLVRGAFNAWEDTMRRLANMQPAGTEQFRVGANIAVTPGKVVYRNRLIEVMRYSPQTRTVHPEPVLIVPSWIMKYYILDLSPQNSLVRFLVEHGHTVFIISWKNPEAEDRELSMDDYLKLGPLAALDVVAQIAPKRKVHGVGYCLGGTLLAIAAAFLARNDDTRLKTVSLLGSEVDFSEPGELGLFIDESQIAYIEDIMRDKGYLDGKQMAGAFALLNSRDLVWSKMVREYLMGTRQPITDLMAWNADATRMPYRMHSEYLRRLYLHNELAAGRYEVDGKPIALADIRVPLFVVSTERDHVSPWRSVYKIHLLTETEVNFLLTSGGHNVGVVNPPTNDRAEYRVAQHLPRDKYIDPDLWMETTPIRRGSWWPHWQSWIASHSGKCTVPAVAGKHPHDAVVLGDAPGTYVFAT